MALLPATGGLVVGLSVELETQVVFLFTCSDHVFLPPVFVFVCLCICVFVSFPLLKLYLHPYYVWWCQWWFSGPARDTGSSSQRSRLPLSCPEEGPGGAGGGESQNQEDHRRSTSHPWTSETSAAYSKSRLYFRYLVKGRVVK